MQLNNRDIALKLIAALYAQGKINGLTYSQVTKRYGFTQRGIQSGQWQSA